MHTDYTDRSFKSLRQKVNKIRKKLNGTEECFLDNAYKDAEGVVFNKTANKLRNLEVLSKYFDSSSISLFGCIVGDIPGEPIASLITPCQSSESDLSRSSSKAKDIAVDLVQQQEHEWVDVPKSRTVILQTTVIDINYLKLKANIDSPCIQKSPTVVLDDTVNSLHYLQLMESFDRGLQAISEDLDAVRKFRVLCSEVVSKAKGCNGGIYWETKVEEMGIIEHILEASKEEAILARKLQMKLYIDSLSCCSETEISNFDNERLPSDRMATNPNPNSNSNKKPPVHSEILDNSASSEIVELDAVIVNRVISDFETLLDDMKEDQITEKDFFEKYCVSKRELALLGREQTILQKIAQFKILHTLSSRLDENHIDGSYHIVPINENECVQTNALSENTAKDSVEKSIIPTERSKESNFGHIDEVNNNKEPSVWRNIKGLRKKSSSNFKLSLSKTKSKSLDSLSNSNTKSRSFWKLLKSATKLSKKLSSGNLEDKPVLKCQKTEFGCQVDANIICQITADGNVFNVDAQVQACESELIDNFCKIKNELEATNQDIETRVSSIALMDGLYSEPDDGEDDDRQFPENNILRDAACQWSSTSLNDDSLKRTYSEAGWNENPYLDVNKLRKHMEVTANNAPIVREIDRNPPTIKASFHNVRNNISKIFCKHAGLGERPTRKHIDLETGELVSASSFQDIHTASRQYLDSNDLNESSCCSFSSIDADSGFELKNIIELIDNNEPDFLNKNNTLTRIQSSQKTFSTDSVVDSGQISKANISTAKLLFELFSNDAVLCSPAPKSSISLQLSEPDASDAALCSPAPKSLTSLRLSEPDASDAALCSPAPKSLTSLQLSEPDASDAALCSPAPKSLTSLQLSEPDAISDAVLCSPTPKSSISLQFSEPDAGDVALCSPAPKSSISLQLSQPDASDVALCSPAPKSSISLQLSEPDARDVALCSPAPKSSISLQLSEPDEACIVSPAETSTVVTLTQPKKSEPTSLSSVIKQPSGLNQSVTTSSIEITKIARELSSSLKNILHEIESSEPSCLVPPKRSRNDSSFNNDTLQLSWENLMLGTDLTDLDSPTNVSSLLVSPSSFSELDSSPPMPSSAQNLNVDTELPSTELFVELDSSLLLPCSAQKEKLDIKRHSIRTAVRNVSSADLTGTSPKLNDFDNKDRVASMSGKNKKIKTLKKIKTRLCFPCRKDKTRRS